MAELASESILTRIRCSHVRVAEGHTELSGDVRLLLELFLSVGEGTIITELALLTAEPKFAELGPLLQFKGRLVRLRLVLSWKRFLQ